jgi:Protein of unknown function (DUF2877)
VDSFRLPGSETVSSVCRTKRVAVLGEFARAALDVHSTGTVLAVFRRSFYIQFETYALCFGPLELGKGPVNVLARVPASIEWPKLGLAPQQKARSSGKEISIATGLRFDCANAEVWQPPHAPPYSFSGLRTGLKRLSRSATRRSPDGLGAILVGLDASPEWPGLSNDLLLQAFRAPVREIEEWLTRALAHQDLSPPDSIQNLIGLGPGLTPSGDDFICGLMTALHYFGLRNLARKISTIVLPVALRETSIISTQYLRCAAEGHASDALFDVLHAILTCRDLEEWLDNINAIGHTSGWDSLAGAALVCAALLRGEHALPNTLP